MHPWSHSRCYLTMCIDCSWWRVVWESNAFSQVLFDYLCRSSAIKCKKKMQDFCFEFGFIKHKILQNVVNLNADIELFLLNILLHFYTYMVALYLYIISSTAHAMLQITLCSLLHTCIPELCKMQMHWYTTMRVYKFMLATQGSKRNHQDIIRQKTICKRIYRCL